MWPAVFHRESERISRLEESIRNTILGRMVEVWRFGRFESQSREPFYLHRAVQSRRHQTDGSAVYAREGIAVELQGDNAPLQDIRNRDTVLDVRLLKSHRQAAAVGSHILSLGIDLDVVLFEYCLQRDAREADVAHSALIPGYSRDARILIPAVARALEHHLVFDLLHLEQVFSTNDDSRRIDQPNQLDLPAREWQRFHGHSLGHVLDIADEQDLFVRYTIFGE